MAKKKQITADSLPLVAIDLGSGSIRAMAAERTEQGLLRILGVEESNKFVCVEQGRVTQTSNAGYMISETLRYLANRIGAKDLPTAFVCLGGRSMEIREVKDKRDQVRKKIVTQDLLDEMEHSCREKIETHNPTVAVLGLVPIFYVLDGEEMEEPPIGKAAIMVEVHYTAFVAKRENGVQLEKSFDQSGKSIEASFVRQDALLSAFVETDGARVLRSGCAVLDLGAQTTTLSVCKGTNYLFTKVIPQGGYHITQVISAQGLPFVIAEKIKRKYGCAAPKWLQRNFKIGIPATDESESLTFTSADLADWIESKLNEILAPLMSELKRFEERIQVLYITGGGAMLQGIRDYIQERTGLEVIYGSHERVLTDMTPDQYYEPTYSSLVGTLLLGTDYRDQHPGKVVTSGIRQKIEEFVVDLFSEQDQETI